MLLTVENLSIGIRGSEHSGRLVNSISFQLAEGESLGIVGESGSGKTLTALSILGLLSDGLTILGGSISLTHGETGRKVEISALSEPELRSYRGKLIAMIFQEPMTSLNPSMRVGDQIRESIHCLPGNSNPSAEEKLITLLKEVHLPAEPAFSNKYPHQLSGGQRQRIMIAMALAGDPALLIADEPTTALDVTVQKKILDLLQEIRVKRNMSLLFISHDLGVIKRVCDRALVMYKGEILESGPVEKLFNEPAHPYTKGLINCRPVLGKNPRRLPTIRDYKSDEPQHQSGTGPAKIPENPKIPEAPKITDNTEIILKVSDLEVNYVLEKNLLGKARRQLTAVDRVSFEIHQGETLGLIGESGCGKSTLGKSIIRLVQKGGGKIWYRGRATDSLKGGELKDFRQKVQFIFQDPFSSLNPKIEAGKAISETIRVHNNTSGRADRQERVIELLEKVGLDKDHYSRYPHEFSGGQRQRLGIARALATEPELIICDESVSSLDVSVQAMILNLLNDLKEDFQLTYLFISHDLAVVKYMSDRILVMKDGSLIEQGNGDRIFSDPSSPYTRSLIDSVLD